MNTKILIADDDQRERDLLRLLLEDRGYEVCESHDGAEALCLLESAAFEIVVTDFHMPRLNGLQLLYIVRQLWPRTSVIMLSGEPADMAQTAFMYGAYAWVRKPFEVNRLLDIISKATNEHAAPQRQT